MTPKPKAKTIEEILDTHAEYYIRQTMQFFKNDGISPALSKNNEGDLTAKQAIEALIAEARIDAVAIVHNNIDVTFNLIERIQDSYSGSKTIDVNKLQTFLCDHRDRLTQLKEKL